MKWLTKVGRKRVEKMNKTLRDKIFEIIENAEETGDADCKEEIEEMLKSNGIEKINVSIDDMFDSPGYDVYSVAVAWIEDGELELAVGSIGMG